MPSREWMKQVSTVAGGHRDPPLQHHFDPCIQIIPPLRGNPQPFRYCAYCHRRGAPLWVPAIVDTCSGGCGRAQRPSPTITGWRVVGSYGCVPPSNPFADWIPPQGGNDAMTVGCGGMIGLWVVVWAGYLVIGCDVLKRWLVVGTVFLRLWASAGEYTACG